MHVLHSVFILPIQFGRIFRTDNPMRMPLIFLGKSKEFDGTFGAASVGTNSVDICAIERRGLRVAGNLPGCQM